MPVMIRLSFSRVEIFVKIIQDNPGVIYAGVEHLRAPLHVKAGTKSGVIHPYKVIVNHFRSGEEPVGRITYLQVEPDVHLSD